MYQKIASKAPNVVQSKMMMASAPDSKITSTIFGKAKYPITNSSTKSRSDDIGSANKIPSK